LCDPRKKGGRRGCPKSEGAVESKLKKKRKGGAVPLESWRENQEGSSRLNCYNRWKKGPGEVKMWVDEINRVKNWGEGPDRDSEQSPKGRSRAKREREKRKGRREGSTSFWKKKLEKGLR